MSELSYVKPERIWLRGHATFNERWVQDRIAEDPSILGLGQLDLKDKERSQPRAGRLDLLLQDPESDQRYEIEVQLGATDENHIIRTVEYWDIERKRYYDKIWQRYRIRLTKSDLDRSRSLLGDVLRKAYDEA